MGWVATLDTATLAGGATEDTANMVSATAVDTPPLDTLDSATLVVTTASVRLSPRLMLMLRLIPTTDTATPDLDTDVDTDTLALATAVDTPPLDTLDSATEATDTPVVTTASVRLRPSLRLMLRLRLIPTEDTEAMVSATAVDTPPLDTLDLDTLVLATAVATPDLATEATPVLEATTASVRPSPRLTLRLIPTTDTATPDLATLA